MTAQAITFWQSDLSVRFESQSLLESHFRHSNRTAPHAHWMWIGANYIRPMGYPTQQSRGVLRATGAAPSTPPVQLHTLGGRAGRYAPPHGLHVVGSKRRRTGCRHERHNDPALTVIVGRVERLLVDEGGCWQQGRRRERGLPIATQRSIEQTYIINQTIWTHYPCSIPCVFQKKNPMFQPSDPKEMQGVYNTSKRASEAHGAIRAI